METFPQPKSIKSTKVHEFAVEFVFPVPYVQGCEYGFWADVLQDSFGAHSEEVAFVDFVKRNDATRKL